MTEVITGLDLVALQLRVAEGDPLPPTALDAPTRRPRHRGPPDRRGPGRRLPPVDGHVPPLRRRRAVGRPRRHRRRVRLDRLAVLRLDGRQGHRPRRAPGTPPSAGSTAGARRPALHGPVTNRDQLLHILAPPGLPRRRPAHRLPRRAPVHRPDPRRRRASPRRPRRWPSRPPTGRAATVLADIPSGWRNNPAVDQVARARLDDAPVTVDVPPRPRRPRRRRRRQPSTPTVVAPTPTRSCSTTPGCAAGTASAAYGDRRFVDADRRSRRRSPCCPATRTRRRGRRRLAGRADAGQRAARARRGRRCASPPASRSSSSRR